MIYHVPKNVQAFSLSYAGWFGDLHPLATRYNLILDDRRAYVNHVVHIRRGSRGFL